MIIQILQPYICPPLDHLTVVGMSRYGCHVVICEAVYSVTRGHRGYHHTRKRILKHVKILVLNTNIYEYTNHVTTHLLKGRIDEHILPRR